MVGNSLEPLYCYGEKTREEERARAGRDDAQRTPVVDTEGKLIVALEKGDNQRTRTARSEVQQAPIDSPVPYGKEMMRRYVLLSFLLLLFSFDAFAQSRYQYYDRRYDGCPPASEDGGYCQTMRDTSRLMEDTNKYIDDLYKRKASCENAAPLCDNGDHQACAYVKTYCAGTFRGYKQDQSR